jgi:amidase
VRRPRLRQAWLTAILAAGLLVPVATASADPKLNLETLTGLQAKAMLDSGEITSVQLTKAYIKRIEALNKRGPGLNAVTQLNKDALKDAAILDKERKTGIVRSPAHGMPILLKDLIDVKGMYTSAGNYSLRQSFPEKDSGIAEKLRERGVIILGKTGLSEYANFFGNQPSGFSNLTGQVLNAVDADQNVSGSSSGSGAAGAAAMSLLMIGTETSGSIIAPSNANGLVGLRPTVGLVPGVGIAPISASQDTAGPMDRTVEQAALTLTAIAGADPESSYAGLWDPRPVGDPSITPTDPKIDDDLIIPPLPATVPDYMSALDLGFVTGKRIGYNGALDTTVAPIVRTPLGEAYDALVAKGAIMVERPTLLSPPLAPFPPNLPGGVGILNYEAKRDINRYYANLGPLAPINSLQEEIDTNILESAQALKFGNATHAASNALDITPYSPATINYRRQLLQGKILSHEGINRMLANDNADPADDFIAILGTVPNGPRAGYPQIAIPMGFNATQRRTVNVQVHAGAYSERDLLGVAYVIEQGTMKRKPVTEINPSMYRCADTVPAPAFSKRGSCNPDYKTLMKLVGKAPTFPFALETESVKGLQDRMTAKRLSAETLTKAYLARIALTNAEGPALQAVRSINVDSIEQAKELDKERKKKGPRGPLHGIPVLLDDVIDAKGLATTGGSIALQYSTPRDDSAIVAKLKKAGAIILGKTNVTELNGLFDANITEGYSSLGGQVLLPSDTDKTPAGSSGGSAAATSAGLAAMTVGMETSIDTAQLIAPAGVAGVVGLKPTVGRVSRDGVLPVAKTQDSPGPIAKTVYDTALQLQTIAGPDVADPGTVMAPPVPDYLAGLTPGALSGKKVAVIAVASPVPAALVPYAGVVTTLQGLGATTTVVTIGAPSATPSITTKEFKRDLNAYLADTRGKGAKSLQEIVDYNIANPVEGLKYQQGQLVEAQAVDLATDLTYESDKTTGKAYSQALIDAILTNGTPDPADDFDVIVVPSGNALIGIADRAGYPVLTVPAGEGTAGAGRNPIGVMFVGGAFSEGKLLAAGYALEQAGLYTRRAPSVTNPSMFRCVPGSAFFSGELCHPGDRLITG